jgi:mono/diheme cytochrome c family protein
MIAIGVCAAAVLGLPVQANEKPPETYQATMKELGAANTALRADLKAVEAAGAYPDYIPVQKDATIMKASFGAALAFWQTKKVDDAVTFARDGAKGVADLEDAIKEKSYAQLINAQMEIAASCAGCHMAHRERLADGTFEIK